MGMYTEIVFGCSLKKDTPPNVVAILKKLIDIDNENDIIYLPNHPFFSCARWQSIARSDSYFFGAPSNSIIYYDDITQSYRLSIRSNLKNYDGEIKKFVDWIKPYVERGAGVNKLLGYIIYEEAEEPTLFYLGEVSKNQ